MQAHDTHDHARTRRLPGAAQSATVPANEAKEAHVPLPPSLPEVAVSLPGRGASTMACSAALSTGALNEPGGSGLGGAT